MANAAGLLHTQYRYTPQPASPASPASSVHRYSAGFAGFVGNQNTRILSTGGGRPTKRVDRVLISTNVPIVDKAGRVLISTNVPIVDKSATSWVIHSEFSESIRKPTPQVPSVLSSV